MQAPRTDPDLEAGRAHRDRARGCFEIVNARGMHARAAAKLAELASGFPCEIWLCRPGEEAVNGKSVMGVLLLCGSQGTAIEVEARGPEAAAAVRAIGELLRGGFGERP